VHDVVLIEAWFCALFVPEKGGGYVMEWDDILVRVIAIGFVVFCVGLFIVIVVKKTRYMLQQKNTNEDKRRVHELMSQVMGDRFSEYTYAIGYYTKTVRGSRKVTYYYYPYILAFTEQELIVFSFIVKDNKILLRNRMDIDWSEVKLDYSVYGKGAKLHLCLAGEWMPIFVHKVVKSMGAEQTDRPLGVYQEQEVERLIELLPRYKSYISK